MFKKSRLPLLVGTCLIIATLLFSFIPGGIASASKSNVSSLATTLTFTPSADAYVISTSPSTNYGTATNLRIDSDPVTRSYLRFSVSGLNGAAVTSAKLRLYANSSNGTGYTVSGVANTTWTESGITYSNAPAVGTAIKTSGAITAGQWVEADVTSYVKADGAYAMALSTTSATNTSLAAREAGANAPQLVVVAGTASATPTTGAGPTATKAAPTATKVSPTATAVSGLSKVTLTKGPSLIYTGSNTAMKIFWQWSANSSFRVDWGTSTAYGSSSPTVSAYDTTNHLFSYTITGLTPGTKYFYRVVTGSQYSDGSFRTAPAASTTSLKFFSYGDTRTNGSVHNGLASQVNAAIAADPAFQTFNIHVGDWVSGDTESAWTGEWFASSYTNVRKQDASIPDIGARGNHESGATYWKRYWPAPFQPGGLYWSFDYGPIHVAVVDQYTSYSAGSAQYNWLKADLAASTKTWKFVVFHEPGWSAAGGHSNNTSVQQNLQPLFTQYGVSIAFAGHNHYYARASVNGVTHLTMGGGGAPSYSPATGQPNIVKTYKGYSFGEFTISGNTLTAKILSNSGSTVDSFTITR